MFFLKLYEVKRNIYVFYLNEWILFEWIKYKEFKKSIVNGLNLGIIFNWVVWLFGRE